MNYREILLEMAVEHLEPEDYDKFAAAVLKLTDAELEMFYIIANLEWKEGHSDGYQLCLDDESGAARCDINC